MGLMYGPQSLLISFNAVLHTFLHGCGPTKTRKVEGEGCSPGYITWVQVIYCLSPYPGEPFLSLFGNIKVRVGPLLGVQQGRLRQ